MTDKRLELGLARLSPAQRTLLELRLQKKWKGMPSPEKVLRRSLEGPVPLSYAQQRLWFLYRLEPESPAYNFPLVLRLSGNLNPQALQQSLSALVKRHSILATNFVIQQGEITQVLNNPGDTFQLHEIKKTFVSPGEREQWLREELLRETRHIFRLEEDFLFRATLWHPGEQEYVLCLLFHHIIFDGWSTFIFLRECSRLYEGYVTGQEQSLPELPCQYADFAAWQRRPEGEVDLQKQFHYWKEHLRGSVTELHLPTDYRRPASSTYKGAIYKATLPEKLAQDLETLCQETKVSLFMLLLAAFSVLLYHYTGQEDILIGSPVSVRNPRETEQLIGFFVNTLVLRTRLAGNPAFSDLLQQVRETALGAYAHQDLPFERLVQELHPQRDPRSTPLFQVMFSVQPTTPDLHLGDLRVQLYEMEDVAAKFALSLDIRQESTSLSGIWEYDQDLFAAETLQRMAIHFQCLLEGIVENVNQRIASLPILTDAEIVQLRAETGQPRSGYIHRLIEFQAQRSPDAIAMVQEGSSITYGELNCRANMLALRLQGAGLGPASLIGLYLERSPELIISMLAVLKAGSAYVPLDPDYPRERLHFMCQDAGLQLLLTGPEQKGMLDIPGVPLIFVNAAKEEALTNEDNLPDQMMPASLAYVMYTSGSTGSPKGVMISHQALLNFVTEAGRCYGVSPGDRVLQFSSLSFDNAIEEIYTSLAYGATLVLRPTDMLGSAARFLRLCASLNVTLLDLPTSYWHQLVVAIDEQALELPETVRLVVIGGEKAHPDYARTWYQRVSAEVRLCNTYGPTEGTVVATTYEMNAADTCVDVPIGRPLNGVQTYILNAEQEPVPPGGIGELYLGGANLAHGYLHRPELTAERFVPDAFSSNPGARLYRTGDLVRCQRDGNLLFLQRRDNQVKVRGFRVEPAEIAATLATHPGVRESFVLARGKNTGNVQLVAYVLVRKNEVTQEDLRDFLRARLPDYMLPASFLFLTAFPLNPNGKIDYDALPLPTVNEPETQKAGPETQLEKQLADIWSQALNLPQIGREEDFFALGGHSLLAIQILSRIQSHLQIEISLRELFTQSTIARLATYIEQKQQTEQVLTTIPAQPTVAAAPLSFAQQRLWFLDQLEPGNAQYNVPTAIRLIGNIDLSCLKQCFQRIIKRHEVLRTCFTLQDGEPVQLVQAEMSPEINYSDLCDLEPAEREQTALSLCSEEARRPFDLQRGPLLRLMLCKMAEQETILLVTLHHIVCDGWSFDLFINELALFYRALSQGHSLLEGEVPDLPIQYKDFAIWQRQWFQGQIQQEQLSYWQKQLASAPLALELPVDHPRPVLQTHNGAHLYQALSPELSSDLKRLSQQEGVTLFVVLLAAFNILLYRYTGQVDQLVGAPIAGRTRSETQHLIGFFANTLVLRTQLHEHLSYRELLPEVRRIVLEAYEHQDLSFEQIVDGLHLPRTVSHSALFQVMFALQEVPLMELQLGSCTLQPVQIETGLSKFDLTFTMVNTPEGLLAYVEYNRDLFEAPRIKRMLDHWQVLLAAVVASPDMPLSQLPLLTEPERKLIVTEWNKTRAEVPAICMHHLFELQVERVPEAPAVTAGGGTLSYRELNCRANQLAQQLQKLGVGPEVVVGICTEPSLEMVIGLLAVLKAGGAYLPLNPTTSSEQRAFMLTDAGTSVLITQPGVSHGALPEHITQLVLDASEPCLLQDYERNCVSESVPANLVYLIYTSGSTGQPKGVAVAHQQLVNYTWSVIERLELQTCQSFAMVSTFAADLGNTVLYSALCQGACLHLLSQAYILNARSMAEYFSQHQIDCLKIVPSHLEALLETEDAQLLPHQRLILGGDSSSWTFLARLQRLAPSCKIFNHYGPTEATVGVLTYPIPLLWNGHGEFHLEEGRPAIPPLGKPVYNTQIYLLDKQMQPVPVGQPGQLYIGGANIARGYFRQPALTAERFVPDPFGTSDGNRLYDTGDLACYLPDGSIEFLGRSDLQVKIRGFRVEPGQIESVLTSYHQIQEALALVEEYQGERGLVAYIIARAGEFLTLDALRGYLKERLPTYMHPAVFVVLPAFPLTANGKIDRQALKLAGGTRLEYVRTYIAPQSELEQTIAHIWQDVLQVERVGIYDNFFDLGGHSLLLIRVHTALREVLQREITILDLFVYPTIHTLVDHLREEQANVTFVRQQERAQKQKEARKRKNHQHRGISI